MSNDDDGNAGNDDDGGGVNQTDIKLLQHVRIDTCVHVSMSINNMCACITAHRQVGEYAYDVSC